MSEHWLEVTPKKDFICHGENYFFEVKENKTHFHKRVGRGFEVIEFTPRKPQPKSIEWLMVEERENAEYIQDW